MVDRRTLQGCAFALVAVAGAIPILFLPKLLFGLGPHPGNDPPFVLVSTACVLVGLAWAGYFSIRSFRRADEFVQSRTKFAWYWGSMIGVMAMPPLLAFAVFGGLHWIAPGLDLSRKVVTTFGFGMTATLVAQMIGFAGVSFWWRVTKQ